MPNLIKLLQNREINFHSTKEKLSDYHLLDYVYSNFKYCPVQEYSFFYEVNNLALDHTNSL